MANFFNRLLNAMKSTDTIRQQIAQRQAQGRPTKQLEDELHARAGDVSGFNEEEADATRDSLQAKQEQLKRTGGWTGPVNRALNRGKSTSAIRDEIAERQAQGKPTQQLEDELRTRSY